MTCLQSESQKLTDEETWRGVVRNIENCWKIKRRAEDYMWDPVTASHVQACRRIECVQPCRLNSRDLRKFHLDNFFSMK
jgi:hypothetical protein